MNKFCKDCSHRTIPDILKEKFNQNINDFWHECPINDKNIYGCTLKFLIIQWAEFFKYLVKEGMLSKNEKKFLEKSGWKISN